ncbi:hypothetical protein HNR23_004915 [Nocardiopsis mwathae]|uniref:Uncharacterized protein n=1 Tax=Nocardiopsis mwathae TaxID=1472723 RepID=A0A7W9YMT0_9ACTN|nr:hypothetical protein [Nocardiopsis mwathae]MBB6174855.1 hypothetical protein [Nocardiopsis mwathae]
MSESTSTDYTRHSLLSQLQAAINRLGHPALMALGGTDYPVLYALRSDGRRVAVVAMRLQDRWWFIAGDSDPIPADNPEMAARSLIGNTKGEVRELFARRPQPRGSQQMAAAAA